MYISLKILHTVHPLPYFESHKMEINKKEPEYTRVSTYTNALIIEYSRIDNKKPSIIGSLRRALWGFIIIAVMNTYSTANVN